MRKEPEPKDTLQQQLEDMRVKAHVFFDDDGDTLNRISNAIWKTECAIRSIALSDEKLCEIINGNWEFIEELELIIMRIPDEEWQEIDARLPR